MADDIEAKNALLEIERLREGLDLRRWCAKKREGGGCKTSSTT